MKRYLLMLGVGAALLAGMATVASAEPYYQPVQRSGVSIWLNLPLFARGNYGYRGGERGWQRRDARGGGWQRGGGGQREGRGQDGRGASRF